MKRFLLGLAALALLLVPALAQTSPNIGMYEASPATIIEGQRAPVLLDTLRRQVVVTSSSSPLVVGGNVASGATDSGNPIKTGCVFNTTGPTVTTGQRVDIQCDSRGNQFIVSSGFAVTGADGLANSIVYTTDTSRNTNRLNGQASHVFNGSTWDRDFTCNASAVVNVTAAATTQIVALVSSQNIRVCGFSVAMSAAGTAKFVYGTGTNCGTGTTDLTGAMPLATGTPWTMSAGKGSVFRTASSNALCVTAVTGNVVGFVNYTVF